MLQVVAIAADCLLETLKDQGFENIIENATTQGAPERIYLLGSDDDVTEVGVRFSGKFGGKIDGALGYSVRDIGGVAGDTETMGGSLSWLHGSGINLTGAYSTTSDDNPANPDADFYLAKLGYKIGRHAFDIHYMETEDRAEKGDSAETLGVGYVFTPIKWFETYAGYNNHSLNRSGADFDDVSTVLVGGRLKF
ncbi:porin [Marinobacter panjinensis]|uniref:porin n=1 Tax=Marinobacter panjinensis TaxID=2576384 RepID=UPI00148522D0|nr:porin [Marinobacter panjinensis]MCR8914885.1 porin [Marinobacter panjinensis]